MNEQERKAKFVEILENAMRRYGYQVMGVLNYEQLGHVLQSRASVTIDAIPNWQPQAEKSPSCSVEGCTEQVSRQLFKQDFCESHAQAIEQAIKPTEVLKSAQADNSKAELPNNGHVKETIS